VDVIAVGDVMLDVRVAAGALEEGGDVHGRVLVRPGGSASNVAVWAAQAGARTRVHGRVGTDTAGALIRDELIRRGVEPALSIDPQTDTGTMLIVHEPGVRSMVADRGANAHLSTVDLPDRIQAAAVLVSGYTLLHEPTFPTAAEALERAQARFVAVDGASWPMIRDFGIPRFFEVTARANALFVNEREAEILTGLRGESAGDVLGQRYPVVCVKLGEAGAVMSWEGLAIRYAGSPVDELDPTGAGDAFDGVLLAHLAAGRSPGDALQAACRAGALVAASFETWPSTAPTERGAAAEAQSDRP
jgi:sugar/nucleoside kinase (ribokinase family)